MGGVGFLEFQPETTIWIVSFSLNQTVYKHFKDFKYSLQFHPLDQLVPDLENSVKRESEGETVVH